MNKKNTIKLLILIMTAGLCGTQAYGNTEVEQVLLTSVQPAVSISKSTASIESGDIDAETGIHSGLQSVFTLQTNSEGYDFVVTSSIMSAEGENVSAYSSNGSILFGHTTEKPTATDISDAKSGGSNNKNVIAYPVTLSAPNSTSTYMSSYKTYKDCYVVTINTGPEETLVHTVGTGPVGGTYQIGQDAAGKYQAVVTVTAVSQI